MVTLRQGKILEKVIEEYIRRAEPISSKLIFEKYSFGVCSATIRGEMAELTKDNFLVQPHPSAGRMPTDKGYRFFVNQLEQKKSKRKIRQKIFKRKCKNIWSYLKEIVSFLSESSSLFAIAGLSEDDIFLNQGWRKILREPEFKDKGKILKLASFVKDFEKKQRKFAVERKVQVYIGRENPIKGYGEFTMIISHCPINRRKQGIVSLVGPTRMAYERNINLMGALRENLENLLNV